MKNRLRIALICVFALVLATAFCSCDMLLKNPGAIGGVLDNLDDLDLTFPGRTEEPAPVPEQTTQDAWGEENVGGGTNAPAPETKPETQPETKPETEAHRHDFSDWTVIVEPTCTSVGKQRRACDCGMVEEEELPESAHKEMPVEEYIDPTCTEPGWMAQTICSVCKQVIREGQVLDPLGHNYVISDYDISVHSIECYACGAHSFEKHKYQNYMSACTECYHLMYDESVVHVSRDEVDLWTEETYADRLIDQETKGESMFIPGSYEYWEKIAYADQTHIYLRAWGWTAFATQEPGIYGYSIDGGNIHYSQDFTVMAEEGVVLTASSMGATSASRFEVFVPIAYLEGEHTIRIFAKSETGYDSLLMEFDLNKSAASDLPDMPTVPVEPVVYFGAAHINDNANAFMSETKSLNIGWAELQYDQNNNSYVSLTGAGEDMYVAAIPMFSGGWEVSRYLAMKYRTTDDCDGEIFLGSGSAWTGQGDNLSVDNISDGEWHLLIIDLNEVTSVTNSYYLGYLRLDCFTDGTDKTMDIGYVAFFDSEEDALAYDAMLNYQ